MVMHIDEGRKRGQVLALRVLQGAQFQPEHRSIYLNPNPEKPGDYYNPFDPNDTA